MKKKLMALVLSGVLFLQSAGIAYGADFSDGAGVEICNDFEKQNEKETSGENTPEADDISEGFSDNNEITEEEQFSGGLEEEQNSQEKELDEENNAVSATASQISGTCGENLKWEFKDGTLTISGNGKMDSFNSSYSTPWHYSAKDIKKLIIKQGVISIGNHAFYGCSGLTNITIPSSVTMVANYDSSFLDEFIENSSDLIYGGYEGWKNYWNNTTKTEQAREILAGLLTSYQGNVEEISMSETADKFVNICISTLKNGNWAYATAYGLNSTEINKLAKLCNNENLSQFFLNKKYDNLAHYLQKVGGYSEDSKIIQCIKSFTESSEYAGIPESGH